MEATNRLDTITRMARTRDADATRRRLLDAATEEFAAHGIAGARVDRIAVAAQANKAQIYAYYGDKLGLFDAVFREHADALMDAVPFDAEDLPGYAARLYDVCLDRAEMVRLAVWTRLERAPTGPLLAGPVANDAKLVAIADAQRSGQVDPAFAPQDVLSMVVGLAFSWSSASLTHAATHADPPADHGRRRDALATAVRRAFVQHAAEQSR